MQTHTLAFKSLLGFSAEISLTTPSIYLANGFLALSTKLFLSAKNKMFSTQSFFNKIFESATAVLVLPTPQGRTSNPFLLS